MTLNEYISRLKLLADKFGECEVKFGEQFWVCNTATQPMQVTEHHTYFNVRKPFVDTEDGEIIVCIHEERHGPKGKYLKFVEENESK